MLLHVFPSAPLCRFSAHSYASAFSCCTYYAAGYRLIFQRIKRNSCAIPLKLYLYVFTLGSILDFIQRLLRLMEHASKQIAWEHFHKIVEFHTYCIIVFTWICNFRFDILQLVLQLCKMLIDPFCSRLSSALSLHMWCILLWNFWKRRGYRRIFPSLPYGCAYWCF